MKRPAHPRRLALESIEDRLLMAGDVRATLNGGNLLVRGDVVNNQIQISQLNTGTLRVQGIGTTVNGQAFFDTAGTVKDIKVMMQQGGTDQFAIQGAFNLAGNLQVRLDSGAVLIEGSDGPVVIGRDLRIGAGADSDVTLRNEVQVRGKTTIDSDGTVNVVAGRATLPTYASDSFSDSLQIDNPYFPLVPGTTYTYEVVEEGAVTEVIVVDVLPETRIIQGVEARVVRDRVWREGRLIEDTFDWYAQDDTGNVWYLGEIVTNYVYDNQGGVSTNPGGSWEAGVNGAVAGVIMEANPQVGERYYQEFNKNDVLDQGEVRALNATATVPAGTFANLLRTKDTSVMEPFGLKDKFFAPGLGAVQELGFDPLTGEVNEIVRLVSAELNGQVVTQVVLPTGFTGTNVSGRLVGAVQLNGAAIVSAAEAVAVIETIFGASAAIASESELLAADTVIAGKATIAAEATIGLRNLTAQQSIRISGEEDAHILASKFRAGTKIVLGDGDNTLAIADSVFAGLEADGGRGQNTFDDGGGNTFSKLKLKRFR